MAIATLKYDLNDSDDTREFELAIKGKDLALAIDQVGQKLRAKCRYSDDENINVEKFREEFWEIVNSYVSNFSELVV